MRLLLAGGNVLLAGLVYTGNLHYAAQLVWQQIIRMSRAQKERAEARRKTH